MINVLDEASLIQGAGVFTTVGSSSVSTSSPSSNRNKESDCELNEHFEQCSKKHCEMSCDETAVKLCTRQCSPPACVCDQQMRRHEGQCILETDCPSRKCPPGCPNSTFEAIDSNGCQMCKLIPKVPTACTREAVVCPSDECELKNDEQNCPKVCVCPEKTESNLTFIINLLHTDDEMVSKFRNLCFHVPARKETILKLIDLQNLSKQLNV